MELLQNFVREHEGSRVIQRILIANNGIAAVKVIRSARKWAYETFGVERIFTFVAMASRDDLRSDAEYIKMADLYVEVPGGRNTKNYANVDLVVEIAHQTDCDAVWAGWGHASENPQLPEALNQAGIIWIGPPPEAMRALGDKIGSTLVAQNSGMSVLPWSGSDIVLPKNGSILSKISNEKYAKACVKSPKEAKKCAEKIGLPVMIKASEGGGGKGIRKVEHFEDIEDAYRQVVSEVKGPIFMMKMVENCRHLEVQIVADESGNAVAIYGRDCSVQRRHQKIIEEGPVSNSVCGAEKWLAMETAAINLCLDCNYVGAGTVEYLFLPDGSHFFLELNPRLQVEHPVSEIISKVNLPVTQILIAMGIPLHRISSIRNLYGFSGYGTGKIDFSKRKKLPAAKHVIACRITSENPEKGFSPTSGMIHSLHFRSTQDVWGYFSVNSKGSLHEFADSQFGHLFAIGDNRENSRKKMALALSELLIRGEIRTTVEFLRRILETEDFVKNNLTTNWLEKQVEKLHIDPLDMPTVVVIGALFKAYFLFEKSRNAVIENLKRGRYFLNKGMFERGISQEIELIYNSIKFCFKVFRCGHERFLIKMINTECDSKWQTYSKIQKSTDGALYISVNNLSHTVYGSLTPTGLKVTIDCFTRLFEEKTNPFEVRTMAPGKFLRFLVKNGTTVKKGDILAEIEAMKITIPISAHKNGIFETKVTQGDILKAGDLIGVFQHANENGAKKSNENSINNSIKSFNGTFPNFNQFNRGDSSPNLVNLENLSKNLQSNQKIIQNTQNRLQSRRNSAEIDQAPFRILKKCILEANDVLGGFFSENVTKLVEKIFEVLKNPNFATKEVFSGLIAIRRKMPFYLFEKCCQILNQNSTKNIEKINSLINEYIFSLEISSKREAEEAFEPLLQILHKHKKGPKIFQINVIRNILNKFCETVDLFKNDTVDQVLKKLCSKTPQNYETIYYKALPHFCNEQIQIFVMEILNKIDTKNFLFDHFFQNNELNEPNCQKAEKNTFNDVLNQIVRLTKTEFVLFKKCRKILLLSQMGDYCDDFKSLEKIENFDFLICKKKKIINGIELKILEPFSSSNGIEKNAKNRISITNLSSKESLNKSSNNSLKNIKENNSFQRILACKSVFWENNFHKIKQVFFELLNYLEICHLETKNADLNAIEISIFGHDFNCDDFRLIDSKMKKKIKKIQTRFFKLKIDFICFAFYSTKSENLIRKIYFKNPTKHFWISKAFKFQNGAFENENFNKEDEKYNFTPENPFLKPSKSFYKRKQAEKLKTSYVEDFPIIIQSAAEKLWRVITSSESPKNILSYQKLIPYYKSNIKNGSKSSKFVKNSILIEFLGKNDEKSQKNLEKKKVECGITVWEMFLKSPFNPKGQKLLVVANDITYHYGSTSILEAKVFCEASRMARREKLPLFYISSNSGARLGVCDEIWKIIKIKNNSNEIDFLYIEEKDFCQSVAEKVVVEKIKIFDIQKGENKTIFKIKTILGSVGLNVENLSASGSMAREMATAYEETFTLSYVTGRSVGIGAYLVRLGQRVIQKRDSPILLTGSKALNKILGHEVYSSNLQIGGPNIMSKCGVSHLIVDSDFEGIFEALRWIFYLPQNNQIFKNLTKNDQNFQQKSENVIKIEQKSKNYSKNDRNFEILTKIEQNLENIIKNDPIEREVEVIVNKGDFDPRILIQGELKNGGFHKGIFDHGSFKEYLSGWANTVIIGRARLGGIAVGLICPEIRRAEKIVPADPAFDSSNESVVVQAGQVWYPDSASKTARSIMDMSKEGLPLFIFANWRGFSGGMRDMFDEILKFGAEIVYALKNYEPPVFVYLPPYSELRGGAWVVLDTMINQSSIEIYAAPSSRGSVLEPEGILDVKFQGEKMADLQSKIFKIAEENIENSKIREFCRKTCRIFADLHDTPQRMLHFNAVRRIVPFEKSRFFFFWRLKFRLAQFFVLKKCLKLKICKNLNEGTKILDEFLKEKNFDFEKFESDKKRFFAILELKREFFEFLVEKRRKILLNELRILEN